MGVTSDVPADRPAGMFLLGNIPVDLSVRVSRLPRAGDDVRGERALALPGGGFTVLDAAWRAGLPGRFAGSHGTGPFGDLVRVALAGIGCEVVLPPLPHQDSGWVVALVDGSGERTIVSSPDAVVPYRADVLASLHWPSSDLVYLSGYSLGLGGASLPLATWVGALPSDRRVFCDLGPWGAAAADSILDPVLRRVDWVSCNVREANRVTGVDDPAAACRVLQRRTESSVVLVRDGAAGCWLATTGGEPELVPTRPAPDVVDTNGAGDTHSGAFLAAVAAGSPVRMAVAVANTAATDAVGRSGGAPWRHQTQHGSREEA